MLFYREHFYGFSESEKNLTQTVADSLCEWPISKKSIVNKFPKENNPSFSTPVEIGGACL